MSSDEDDRTIFGRALPQPPAPSPARPAPAAPASAVEDEDDDRTILTRRPDVPTLGPQPRISLQDAVGKAVPMRGKGSNPLLACAADVLGLLGVLRAGQLEMDRIALRQHLLGALHQFQGDAVASNAVLDDITDSTYALAATCDDIVRNLPGADAAFWTQNSLTAELFDDPNPGVGFFTRLHRLSGDPARRAFTLEVMLACLALGFEGQYRTAPDGPVALLSLRSELYQRVRSVLPRPRVTLSYNWMPVIPRGTQKHARMPIWAIGSIGAAMVVTLYAALAWSMTRDADLVQQAMLNLHNPEPSIEIDRVNLPDLSPEVVVYEAPETGQVDRLRDSLAAEIAAGLTSVAEEGDFIALRLGEALQFPGGAAELSAEAPIIGRIAEVLNEEPGAIIVEGHSDNIPLRGTGRFKTNEELSAARAAAVRDILARSLTDPTRLSVVGVGAAKPLDRADTPEARARNRRVDILLRKEERL